MPFGLYKPGQGKWARGIGAAALVGLGIWAAMQTRDWIATPDYTGYIAPAIILAVFLTGAYFLTNRPRAVDFLIDTEVEMRKVNWPTSREVLGATAVVIVVVLMLGVYLFFWDNVLMWLFRSVHILPSA